MGNVAACCDGSLVARLHAFWVTAEQQASCSSALLAVSLPSPHAHVRADVHGEVVDTWRSQALSVTVSAQAPTSMAAGFPAM